MYWKTFKNEGKVEMKSLNPFCPDLSYEYPRDFARREQDSFRRYAAKLWQPRVFLVPLATYISAVRRALSLVRLQDRR